MWQEERIELWKLNWAEERRRSQCWPLRVVLINSKNRLSVSETKWAAIASGQRVSFCTGALKLKEVYQEYERRWNKIVFVYKCKVVDREGAVPHGRTWGADGDQHPHIHNTFSAGRPPRGVDDSDYCTTKVARAKVCSLLRQSESDLILQCSGTTQQAAL
jgi:hypothetical protein